MRLQLNDRRKLIFYNQMEAELDQYAGQYEIVSLLGEGGQASVYLGRRNENRFALKVYRAGASREAAYRKEVEVLSAIEHENHIKMLDRAPAARFKLSNTTEEHRPLIVLELAEGGQLFDYLSRTGRFSAELTRTYAKQLIGALRYLHSLGLTHRDLKPENILFDKIFTLKVSDFGLARDARGDHGDYELTSCVGTTGYRAPEVETRRYEGLGADMFAIGVVLFIMYTGTPPFLSTRDRIYAQIRNSNYAQFWQLHDSRHPPDFYPDSFKRLINSFLCLDPQRRPSFQTLAADEWLSGPVLTRAALFEEMRGRAVRLGLNVPQPNLEELCDREGYRSDLRLEDELVTKEEVFAYHYHTLNIKEDALPQYELSSVAYVDKEARFVVSWLHYFLMQQREAQTTFLTNFVYELKFLRFHIAFTPANNQLALSLVFEVDSEEETELLLLGQLHRSPKNWVGIKWEKQEGNSYWLSEVQAQITSSLLHLH